MSKDRYDQSSTHLNTYGDTDNDYSLDWLIHPLSTDEFSQNVYGSQFIKLQRNDKDYFSGLLTDEELDFILLVATKTSRAVEALSEDEKSSFCRSHAETRQRLLAGQSLRIDGIQRFSRSIALLARRLEKTISCPVNVNLYLSPGSGKKALRRHFDTHDVFVLQIFGRKHWRIYDEPSPAPLQSLPLIKRESERDMRRFRLEHDTSRREQVKLRDEFALEAGQTLYLPRGVWHEAESPTDAMSCHLTIGLHPTTFLDILTLACARTANKLISLRRSLPMGFASADASLEQTRAIFREAGEKLLDDEVIKSSFSDMIGVLSRQHATGLDNNYRNAMPSQTAPVTSDQLLRVREGVSWNVDGYAEPPKLRVGESEFAIDTRFVGTCQAIFHSRVFCAKDLQSAISEDERLVLINQMMQIGLVEPCVKTAKQPKPVIRRDENSKHLLVRLRPNPDWADVISVAPEDIREPFLLQTIRRLESTADRRCSKVSLRSLVDENSPPCAGFIFHISRCGSTLLSNSLRGVRELVVLSEPKAVNQAVRMLGENKHVETGPTALEHVISAYETYADRFGKKAIIKFSSWNLLYLAEIVRLFPQTPIIVVIRNPLEVAVSHLLKPAGWSKFDNGLPDVKRFGAMGDTVGTTEENIVTGIEVFLRSIQLVHPNVQIVDYNQLNEVNMIRIAEYFGASPNAEDGKKIASALHVYSKDPRGTTKFIKDGEEKALKATPDLVRLVEQRLLPLYKATLTKTSRWEA